MSEAVFDRFAPFIQEYIYSHNWESLREVQVEAAKVLFDTDCNLLLSSATASGKTEAAFFPLISMLYENPASSFGVLYIAPLKSLINDQFRRLEELLDLTEIPVFHWHGDVATSHKQRALAHPAGILQITPESLEAMLMRRPNDAVRLFADLRFVVIDEMHILTGSDRGNQIQCLLARLQRLIGHIPRRIGLSATLGDLSLACAWLGAGSDRETIAPALPASKVRWRLGLEHFYMQNERFSQSELPSPSSAAEAQVPARVQLDAGYEYVYDCTKGKKCLVFSNSREETEYVTATLRQIAEHRGEKDRFLIHHGNLSAALREEAETRLREEEGDTVTCATVTLELGVDIGRLERILQLDAPHSISSFLQRLGRSGRRGDPPEMMMVFREETPLPNAPLPSLIPFGLLRAIAIIQLYLEERFIEPPSRKKLPFSLLFQQTLSVLASGGALNARALAERVLVLPPFSAVTREDYRTLLLSMLRQDFLEMTDERELIIGLKGERLIQSFKFYAVFRDSEDFTVRCDADEIGTITTPPPIGDRFALAGRVWEVIELDSARRLIYVKAVKGKMEISWPGDYGEVHTRILERMRQVLAEDTVYPYLKPNAVQRLAAARAVARNTHMVERSVVHLGGFTYAFFPWLGTRSFRTLRKYLMLQGEPYKISNLEFEGCYYMTFRMERGSGEELLAYLCDRVAAEGIDRAALVGNRETPVFEKYDEWIPGELLRRAYTEDHLRTDEIMRRLPELLSRLRKDGNARADFGMPQEEA